MLEKKLAEIADIPSKLDNLIEKMEKSNSVLASSVSSSLNSVVRQINQRVSQQTVIYDKPSADVTAGIPLWMKWTIVISVICIALACITNTVYNIGYNNSHKKEIMMLETNNVQDSIAAERQDSTNILNENVQDTAYNKRVK